MSVREEDKEKSKCSGRGLGLAAAAIGVGVGAALYYFLSKREEDNPHGEGSSATGWGEQREALPVSETGPREDMNMYRAQVFRERSWSLEECTICCEVMLKNHTLEMLPCGHKFHGDCVQPWLAEHQTCPNCRKNA